MGWERSTGDGERWDGQDQALTSAGSAAVLAQKRLLRAMPEVSAVPAAGGQRGQHGDMGGVPWWAQGTDSPGGLLVGALGTRFSAGFRGLREPLRVGAKDEASVLICKKEGTGSGDAGTLVGAPQGGHPRSPLTWKQTLASESRCPSSKLARALCRRAWSRRWGWSCWLSRAPTCSRSMEPSRIMDSAGREGTNGEGDSTMGTPGTCRSCPCPPLTSRIHQRQALHLGAVQDLLQVPVLAVEGDVGDVPHHDVLHPHVVFPARGRHGGLSVAATSCHCPPSPAPWQGWLGTWGHGGAALTRGAPSPAQGGRAAS